MIIHWAIFIFLRTGVVQLQDSKLAPIQIVNLEDNVTIQCNLPQKRVTTLVWYKQSVGQNPRLLAIVHNYLHDIRFQDEFQNGRFTVSPERGSFDLNITAVTQKDTGTYYCGIIFLNELQFVSWTFLMPAGIATKTGNFVELPVLKLVHPGYSVILECTVFTRRCSGDHSVYWFKHGSGESYPGIIYTEMTDSPTQSCVYKLPKKDPSLSNAGMYYCIVAMCGEILFGNGTALNLSEAGNSVWDPKVVGFAFTNALTVTVSIALVLDLWNIRRKQSKDSTNNLTNQILSSVLYSDDLNYAAVNFIPNHSAYRKVRRTTCKEKSVYADITFNSKD